VRSGMKSSWFCVPSSSPAEQPAEPIAMVD